MASKDLAIRIAGESGEGVISTGELTAQAAARAGFELQTFKTFPSEIRGGQAVIQLRISGQPVYTHGDEADVLLVFNEDAYRRNVGELKRGGALIYDSTEFEPPAGGEYEQYGVPLTEMARTELKFELGKNIIAVGLVVGALRSPT